MRPAIATSASAGLAPSPDVASVALAGGLTVMLAVAYDYYRRPWGGDT